MAASKYLKNLDSFIAAVIGFIAIHTYTKYSGVGISPDSIMYASTAHNIYKHGSLMTFNGGPLVFFPVFYPAFLSFCLLITGGTSTIAAAPIINGILFGSVIFISGYIISKFNTKSLVYKWLILFVIILSPGLLEIYTYLWSETLFIVEVMLFPLLYRQYIIKHTIKSLLWVCLLTAIACITRYIGVTLILTGGLMLLLDKGLPIRKKIYHIVLFGFASISLVVVNIIINKLSSGLSTGTREPSITPLGRNLYNIGCVFSDWMGLPDSAHHFAITISCVILLFLIGLIICRYFKGNLNTPEGVITMFAAIYGIFLPVLATFSRFEPLNSRLMSPVFVYMLIGITCWVPELLEWKKTGSEKREASPFAGTVLFLGIIILFVVVKHIFWTTLSGFFRYEPSNDYSLSPILICLLTVFIILVPVLLTGIKSGKQIALAIPFVALMLIFEYSTAATDYQRYDDENDYGVPGYTDDDWNGKPFITFLKTHPDIYKPGIPKYTDADEAVYFFTGSTAKLLPHRYFNNTVQQFYTVKHYYLIWFNALNNTELIGLQDIQKREKLKLLYEFPEGAVYEYDAGNK